MRQVLVIALLLCASASLVYGVTLWGWDDNPVCLGPPTGTETTFVMPEPNTPHNCSIVPPGTDVTVANPLDVVCQENTSLVLGAYLYSPTCDGDPPGSLEYPSGCYASLKRAGAGISMKTTEQEASVSESFYFMFTCGDSWNQVTPYVRVRFDATCAAPSVAAPAPVVAADSVNSFVWSNVPGVCSQVYNTTSNAGPSRWAKVDYPCLPTDTSFTVPLYTQDDCAPGSFERDWTFDLGSGCQTGGYTASCFGVAPPETPVSAPTSTTTPGSATPAPESATPAPASGAPEDSPDDDEPDSANTLSLSLSLLALLLSSLLFM